MSTLGVGILKSTTAAPPVVQNSSEIEVGQFCRAWVNFNGTGTVAIRASFNVSSITDNGVGNYNINFTNNMPDANYSYAGGSKYDVNDSHLLSVGEYYTGVTKSVSTFRAIVGIGGSSAYAGTRQDSTQVSLAFFR